jgi:hypothetical protein
MRSKMLTKICFTTTLFTVLLLVACDSVTELKNEGDTLSEVKQGVLKVSLNKSAEALSDAVIAISGSEDFKLMSQIMLNANQSSDPMQRVSEAAGVRVDSMRINLSDISGVYEYAWRRVRKAPNQIIRFFDRVDDDDNLIVKLPVQKVRNYHALFTFQPKDTLLTNNFEISVSDYLLSRHFEKGLEYNLTSEMSLDGNSIGSLSVERTRNKINGLNFLSEYSLASGFTVSNLQNTGDTAVSVYAISHDNVVLYEEKITSYRVNQENKLREKIYSLTIGNVQVVRTPGPQGFEEAKVYVDGVLQINAKVELIIYQPDVDNLGVTNQKRDVKITFEDGTSTTIRELKGSTIEDIGKIFLAVRQAGFASEIVDRIATNLYWQKK